MISGAATSIVVVGETVADTIRVFMMVKGRGIMKQEQAVLISDDAKAIIQSEIWRRAGSSSSMPMWCIPYQSYLQRGQLSSFPKIIAMGSEGQTHSVEVGFGSCSVEFMVVVVVIEILESVLWFLCLPGA